MLHSFMQCIVRLRLFHSFMYGRWHSGCIMEANVFTCTSRQFLVRIAICCASQQDLRRLAAAGCFNRWKTHLKVPWCLLEQEKSQMASKYQCEWQIYVPRVVSA
jgi:hypothetical protein